MQQLPPGPEQSPILQWAHWIRNPRGFLEKCSKRYGYTFTVRFPGRPPMVWLAEPSSAESILATERENFEARGGTSGNVFSAFVGEGSLLVMTGARHRQERRLIDPLFHGQHLSDYEDPIREVTDRAIDRFPIHRAFPLYPVLEDIATGINIRTLLGPAGDGQCERLKDLFFQFVKTMTPHPMSRLAAAVGLRLTRRNTGQRIRELKSAMYALFGQEIARFRANGNAGRDDLLARLAAARDGDCQTASEAEAKVCDQLLTFLIAGHGTTATSLSWALTHILENREIEERVRQEIHQVFGDEPAQPERNTELKYLDAVIKEALRLHPPFLIVTRLTLNAVSLEGYELPAGTPVALSPYLLHRRPDLWPSPDEFRPERFLESRPSPFEYIPFGGGHRMCTGNVFAMSLSRGVLARVLSRASLHLAQGVKIRPELWRTFTSPKGGPPVRMEKSVVPASEPGKGLPLAPAVQG
jgi:cytochrome P450